MTEQEIPEIKINNDLQQEKPVEQIKSETSQAIPEENQQERDWRKFRENRQKEREAAALETQARLKAEQEAAALKAALEAVVNKGVYASSQQQNYNEYEEETEEQKIDRRVAEALKKREAEYEKRRLEEEQLNYPTKLRNTYKDFEQVCSPENLDYLEYHHPELAKNLARMPQSFDKWADIYNAIRRYIPNVDSKKDMSKMEKNMQKPQSISQSNLSPPGQQAKSSWKEIEERRAARWKEMERMRKSIG